MHDVQLQSLDLNLLLVLDVLLEEQSISRAAKRLHRSPSAVSHALARLREHLGDPLLLRDGQGMKASPWASAIQPALRRHLTGLQRVLTSEERFVAATSERTFRLVAPDLFSGLLPRLYAALHDAAPRASLEVIAPHAGAIERVLDGDVDLAIGPLRSTQPSRLVVTPLPSMHWSVFGRRGHPALDAPSFERWLAAPHLVVRTASKSKGVVERHLAEAGRRRHVALRVSGFAMAPPVVAKTDLLLTVPASALRALASAYDLEERPAPFEIAPLSLGLYSRRGTDDALAFVRALVKSELETALAPRTHQRSS
ncbi:MAG: LysR family transcriptional regulator [Myxococcota bacterium]